MCLFVINDDRYSSNTDGNPTSLYEELSVTVLVLHDDLSSWYQSSVNVLKRDDITDDMYV